MHDTLKNRYNRWPVWLESPIETDKCSLNKIQRLVDLGSQHIEELRASDDNAFSKLIEE